MKTLPDKRQPYEFCFPQLDTLVQVEERNSGLIIRATRDTFSPQRKDAFIRELALEGFISDKYLWTASQTDFGPLTVFWIIDFSWLVIGEPVLQRSRRFMAGLISATVVLWVVLMSGLFLYSDR